MIQEMLKLKRGNNERFTTIIIVGNPIFTFIFYTKEEKFDLDNDHRQCIIWIPSMILAVFCSAMLAGIVGG